MLVYVLCMFTKSECLPGCRLLMPEAANVQVNLNGDPISSSLSDISRSILPSSTNSPQMPQLDQATLASSKVHLCTMFYFSRKILISQFVYSSPMSQRVCPCHHYASVQWKQFFQLDGSRLLMIWKQMEISDTTCVCRLPTAAACHNLCWW